MCWATFWAFFVTLSGHTAWRRSRGQTLRTARLKNRRSNGKEKSAKEIWRRGEREMRLMMKKGTTRLLTKVKKERER